MYQMTEDFKKAMEAYAQALDAVAAIIDTQSRQTLSPSATIA